MAAWGSLPPHPRAGSRAGLAEGSGSAGRTPGPHSAGEGGLLSPWAAPGPAPASSPMACLPSAAGAAGVLRVLHAAMNSNPTEPQWLSEEEAPPAPASRFPRRVPPQGTLWERATATEWVQPPHMHPGHMGPDDAEGRCVCSVCTCAWKVSAPGRSGERPSVEPVASLPPACPHPPVHLYKPLPHQGSFHPFLLFMAFSCLNVSN